MRKTVLVINIERDGYAPNQIYNTMTVEELIDELKNYPDDMQVYVGNDRHYTFSGITESCFEEYVDEDDYEDEE